MIERKTFAVIVTYNREKYLKILYERLLEIDELNGIFILNNNGNDNTDIIFENANLIENKVCKIYRNRKEIYYYRNECNLGGAGGFKKAFDMVCGYEWDYLWIMDDDVLPEKDCLKKLLDKVDDRFKICIPNRTDERFVDCVCIKYDLSNPFKFRMKNRVKVISCNNIKKETVEVLAMPFEGPLIGREIIEKVGLPDDKYFIIYDDSDYCRRCLKFTKARMVMNAKLHKQIIPIASNEVNWKNYYAYRNCFAFDHKYCTNELARRFRPWLIAHSLMLKTWITRDILRFKVLRKAYQDYKAGVMGKVITIENFNEMF